MNAVSYVIRDAVCAGIPCPADCCAGDKINLDTHSVNDPDATFLVVAKSDANHDIFAGDAVLIDVSCRDG